MKNKTTAAILALFFGSLCVHHFYLGDNQKGTKYLLISLLTLGVGATVMAVFALIDGINLFSMSDAEFAAKYGNSDNVSLGGSGESNASVAEQQTACSQDYKNNIETLKKYKELLDIGAITQEEFEKLKQGVLSNE